MSKIRILFQGDSITDAGRNRFGRHSLAGYPKCTAALLQEREGKAKYDFFNRGVSGNRSCDLLRRYRRDFVRIRPDVVTIMIGINDVWRKYDSNNPTTPGQYEANLIKLCNDLRADTNAKIILLSPYLTPDPKGKHDEMREDVDIFIEVCRSVAEKYADGYINTDIPMNQAVQASSPAEISGDGVHPLPAGQAVLAELLANAISDMCK